MLTRINNVSYSSFINNIYNLFVIIYKINFLMIILLSLKNFKHDIYKIFALEKFYTTTIEEMPDPDEVNQYLQ